MSVDFEVIPEECFYNNRTQIAQFTFQNSGTADVTTGETTVDGVDYWFVPIVEVTTDSSESTDRRWNYFTESPGDVTIPAGTVIYKKNNLNYYYKTATDYITTVVYSTHVGKSTGTTYYIKRAFDVEGGGFKDYIVYYPGLKAGDDLKIQLNVIFEDSKIYMFAADDFTYSTWPNTGDVTETIDDSHDPPEDRNNYYVISTGNSVIAEIEGISTISNYTEDSTEVTLNSTLTDWDSYLSQNPGNESTVNKTFLKKIFNDITVEAGITGKTIVIPKEYLSMDSLSSTTTSYQLFQASSTYSVDMSSQNVTDGVIVLLEDTESFTIDLNDNNSSDILQESSEAFRVDYILNSIVRKTYSKTKSEKISFQQSTDYKVEYRMNPLQIEFVLTEPRSYLQKMIPNTRQTTSMLFSIKVVQNALGENVFAVRDNYESEFYRQPNLSFNSALNKYGIFNVSDSSMSPYTLVFGTTQDGPYNNDVSDIVVKYKGDNVKLVTDNTNDVHFFEQNNAKMGYSPISSSIVYNSENLYSRADMSSNLGSDIDFMGTSPNGKYIYAFNKNNNSGIYIFKSSDYGHSFTTLLLNDTTLISATNNSIFHDYLFVNSTGLIALIHGNTDSLLTVDGGSTWTRLNAEAVCSDNGQYIATVSALSNVYTIHVSSDYGANWTSHSVTGGVHCLAMSSSGQYLYVGNFVWSGGVGTTVMSNDYGATFTTVTINNISGDGAPRYIQCSGDGKYAYFCSDYQSVNSSYPHGFLYTSDYGVTISPWTGMTKWDTTANTIRQNVGMSTVSTPTDSEELLKFGPYTLLFSHDGKYQALHFGNRISYNYDSIFTSEDYGVTWTIDTSIATTSKTPNLHWTMSKSGKHIYHYSSSTTTYSRHDYRYTSHTVEVENDAFVIDGVSKKQH